MCFNTGLNNDVENTRELADQVNQEIGGGGFTHPDSDEEIREAPDPLSRKRTRQPTIREVNIIKYKNDQFIHENLFRKDLLPQGSHMGRPTGVPSSRSPRRPTLLCGTRV